MADEEQGVAKASTVFKLGDKFVDGWGNEVENPEAANDVPDNTDYESWKGSQLVAELKRRNADRDDDTKIVPDGKTKADVAAALTADDEANVTKE